MLRVTTMSTLTSMTTIKKQLLPRPPMAPIATTTLISTKSKMKIQLLSLRRLLPVVRMMWKFINMVKTLALPSPKLRQELVAPMTLMLSKMRIPTILQLIFLKTRKLVLKTTLMLSKMKMTLSPKSPKLVLVPVAPTLPK